MFNKPIPISIIFLAISMLSACGSTQPPPYQKDVQPENRTEYNGVEGMAQHQKDQRYVIDKELADKCSSAKINLVIAEAEKNAEVIKEQKEVIESTCI